MIHRGSTYRTVLKKAKSATVTTDNVVIIRLTAADFFFMIMVMMVMVMVRKSRFTPGDTSMQYFYLVNVVVLMICSRG